MARKKQTPLDAAKEAGTAHCDLNMWYAVIALLESSLISSDHYNAEARVIAICKMEAGKALRRMDAALARLNG